MNTFSHGAEYYTGVKTTGLELHITVCTSELIWTKKKKKATVKYI